MNRATRLYVTIQGIFVAVSGIIHGVSEVLQGNRPTEGLLLEDPRMIFNHFFRKKQSSKFAILNMAGQSRTSHW